MATEKELIQLEKIQEVMGETSSKDVPEKLSRGRIGYEKAIKSMRSAGTWTLAVSILSISAAIIFLALRLILFRNPPKGYEIYGPILSIAISVLAGVLGYKLWKLQVTPLSSLVSLIIVTIYNLLLVCGIVPLIAAIVSIVALCRYSTFCNWFRGVK